MVNALSMFTTGQRLKIALGGFISFTGLIILVVVFLVASNAVDINLIIQNEVIIGAIVLIGIIDVVCGFFLIFKEKIMD